MRPVLIFPPLADPSQPYSALPALTAFLRERAGFESVQIDANIGFVLDRLNGPKVREAGKKIRQRLEQLDEEPSLAEQQAVEYAFLISAALKGPMVERGIDSAVLGLRDPSVFADLGRLDRCKRLVDEALEIHSAVSYPIRIGFSNATAPDFTDPGELTAYAENTGSNPFIDFLASETLSRIEAATPDLVGISITYRTQVLPAVTLARLIRRRMPGVPVVLGGSIVSRWYDRIEDCPGVFDWCDYLIPFEGESALVALLGALAGERPLDRVPNLVYRENDRIRRNPVAPEEIDALPTPDYRGLPLERYLSPDPVLMLNTSRGCYWGKCHFCSVSPAMRRSYRARSTDLVHDDIVTLNARHGSTCIAFGDDCVAPATLAALARRLRERGPAISWQCEVRFEKALTTALLGELRDAGCVNLIFGLESYDPGVRERMGKGVQQREIDRILDDCRRLGIAFNLQFFFGFPGETRSEAEITAGLVSREMHGAATFSFGVFELQQGAGVEREPAAFGIGYVDRRRGPLAVRFDYAPAPIHAEEMRKRLRQALFARLRYRHIGLSINAHTLAFLHRCGVPALADCYRADACAKPTAAPDIDALLQMSLVPGPMQNTAELSHSPAVLLDGLSRSTAESSRTMLVYDYDLDRIVEVPRLAVWLMHHLDGRTTPAELVQRLALTTGVAPEPILAGMREIVGNLFDKGFIKPGEQTDEGSTMIA